MSSIKVMCLIAVVCSLQLLELVYLIYQGQFLYPILISIFTVPAVHGMATVLNQQHGKVMALMNESRLMPMVQEKLVRAIASHRLVPGDVTVLHKGRALCDMVMLRGACLVTESVLSGEVGVHHTVYPFPMKSCRSLAITRHIGCWLRTARLPLALVLACCIKCKRRHCSKSIFEYLNQAEWNHCKSQPYMCTIS